MGEQQHQPEGARQPALRVVGGTVEDPRPLIRISTELHDVVDQGVAALQADDDLYQRDRYLVHILRATKDEAEEDPSLLPDAPQIRQTAPATLRERLTRVAKWEKFDKRSKKWERAIPTDQVVHAVLSRGEWKGIREILGIIEAPAIRPDGSLITTPGYDPATSFLYQPSMNFPPIPASPTQQDAKRAFAALAECFCDFPCRSEEHRSTAIAAVLSLIARPAIQGCVPAFIFDANTRGSGKTLLSDTVATIAMGRATAKMSYPADDTELEKVLGAYALRGTALVNFDNVIRPFGGGPLDRCLTAEDKVELRVLGKSEIPTLRWRSVILATGNNVVLSGDTARRVLLSRLESPLENPEDRAEFKHPNLLEWVRAERPRLVCAALTLLRAFFVAGRPRGGCKAWGSFEPWSALIPPAIVFAGGADPLRSRPSVEGEEEPEKQALAIILRDWPRLDKDKKGLTAKTAIGSLYSVERLRGQLPPDGFEDLREAIELLVPTKPGTAPDATRLGNRLVHVRERVVGGAKLVAVPGGHGVKRWRVVSIDANATALLSSSAETKASVSLSDFD